MQFLRCRHGRVKEHCIQRGLPWEGTLASSSCSEQEYYEDLLAFYRQTYRVCWRAAKTPAVLACVAQMPAVWTHSHARELLASTSFGFYLTYKPRCSRTMLWLAGCASPLLPGNLAQTLNLPQNLRHTESHHQRAWPTLNGLT